MQKIITAILMNGLMIGTVLADCTYPLDASQTQLTLVDSTMIRYPSIQGSKVAFTVQPTTAPMPYMAMSSAFANNKLNNPTLQYADLLGDKAIATSGIMAFELKFKIPTTVLPTGESIIIFPMQIALTNSNHNVLTITLMHVNGQSPTNNFLFMVNGENQSSGVLSLSLENTLDGYQNFGFYINQTTKQVGYIFNGVNKGYIANYDNSGSALSYIIGGGTGTINNGASIIGETISYELITDHSKLQYQYPTGTKDICGNSV